MTWPGPVCRTASTRRPWRAVPSGGRWAVGGHRSAPLVPLPAVGTGLRSGRSPVDGQLVGKESGVLIRLLSSAPDSVSTPLLL